MTAGPEPGRTIGEEEEGVATFGDLVVDPVAEDEYERVLDRLEVDELRDLTEGLGEREAQLGAPLGRACAAE